MNFGLIRESLPDILEGLGVTMLMWLPGAAIALAGGLVVAILRHYGGPVADRLLQSLLGIIRGTPFLVQIFLLYYGGPFVGLDLEAPAAGLIGISVYGTSYFAEIIRGGFASVPRGHLEAASCVGLTRGQTLLRVLLPEVALLILPASINMLVVLMKETAILSIITVPELTATVTGIASLHFAYAEGAFILALCYWGLTELTGRLGRVLEIRLQRFRLA
ncbi:MAG: amino acid ABC transporter permease [Acetobacteraceae bacterium]|nr:amino acid ABC transporter permease [Acetobacteraceae bacterium]